MIAQEFWTSLSATRQAPEPVRSVTQRATPVQSAYTPSSQSGAPATSGLAGQDPVFYIVPKSVTREALEAKLFPIRDPAVMCKFQSLNPKASHVKASSMIVLSDPNNTSCTYQEAQLMQTAQQYASHVEATSRAAKYMMGGYIGIGLGGVSSVLAIQQVCNGDSGAACEKVKFTEGGKFAGSTAIGAASGLAASYTSTAVCVALGVTTGIGGVICVAAVVGTGAWVGTTYGGKTGEYIGEKIYEARQP